MNFRIIKHLFLADVRRLRWLILAVLVLVALQTFRFLFYGPWDLPFPTRLSSSSLPPAYSIVGSNWPDLSFPFAIAAGILAAAVGWQGAAAEAVRPVRMREKLAAKVFLLTVFLFLPQAVAILLVLGFNGVAAGAAVRGMVVAAGAFVPLWLLVAAYGRLAGSFWSFVGAALLSSVGMILCVILARSFGWNLGLFADLITLCADSWGRYSCLPVWCLLGLGVAEILLLLVLPARSWKTWRRCAAGSLLLLATAGILRPLQSLAVRKKDSAGGAFPPGALAGIRPVAPPVFTGFPYAAGDNRGIRLTGVVGTEGLPPGVYCPWILTGGGTLTADSGSVLHVEPWEKMSDFWRSVQSSPVEGPEFEKSLSSTFSGMGLALEKGSRSSPLAAPFSPDHFPLGDFGAKQDFSYTPGGMYRLSGYFTGVLFRNRVLADVAITDPNPVEWEGGWLRVRAWRDRTKKLPQVELLAVMPSDGTMEEPLMRTGAGSRTDDWRIFLCLPRLGTVFRSVQTTHAKSGALLAGACAEQRLLRFGEHQWKWDIKPDDLEGARLIILKTEFAGMVERNLTTRALPMTGVAAAPVPSDFQATASPPMEPRIFLEKMRGTVPDPATAPDSEIGIWLSKCVATYGVEEWLAPRLALLVPDHLAFLLEFCRVESRGRKSSLEAMVMALPGSRKSEIIDRLEEFPWLLDVVRKRGWEGDAKETLLRLVRAGKLESGMDMVAAFAGPDLYPLLLAEMEKTGNWYSAIHRLPGIEPALTESVRRYFERVTVGGKVPAGVADSERLAWLNRLALPLRHGLPGAAADALVLFPWANAGRAKRGLDWMERFFQLPPGVERKSDESLGFFLNLKPEDVRWDAFTRRWTTAKF